VRAYPLQVWRFLVSPRPLVGELGCSAFGYDRTQFEYSLNLGFEEHFGPYYFDMQYPVIPVH
jgi:hypothetical protein